MNLENLLNNFIYISSTRETGKKKDKLYFRIGYNYHYDYESSSRLQVVEVEKLIKRIVKGLYYFYAKVGFDTEVLNSEETELKNNMEKMKNFQEFEKMYSDYEVLAKLISSLSVEKLFLIYLISIMSRGINVNDIDIFNYSKYKGGYDEEKYLEKIDLFSEVEYDFINSTIVNVLEEIVNKKNDIEYDDDFSKLFSIVYNSNVKYYSRIMKEIERKFKGKIEVQSDNRVSMFNVEIVEASNEYISDYIKLNNSLFDFNIINIKKLLKYIKKLYLKKINSDEKFLVLKKECTSIHFNEIYKIIEENNFDSMNIYNDRKHKMIRKVYGMIKENILDLKKNIKELIIIEKEIKYLIKKISELDENKIHSRNLRKQDGYEWYTKNMNEYQIKSTSYKVQLLVYNFICIRVVNIMSSVLKKLNNTDIIKVIEDEAKKKAKTEKELKLEKYNIEMNYFKVFQSKIFDPNIPISKFAFDSNRRLQMYLSTKYILTFDSKLEKKFNEIAKNINIDLIDLDIYIVNNRAHLKK